ncbi:outer membrane protein [Pseudogemmobacter humi]|uniref:Outer membrane protein beta-barrel domain-containing protein n=1 Tax=Pseudogemmobacter humi TaxID=2483812 RepID=A0A3P5X845_9RHOB|nr:porin family protein [Pseudogemmobacter humi]VDC30837.1 hypothetical protein XINFAN_02736 [Pseudogemmobacter humi]
MKRIAALLAFGGLAAPAFAGGPVQVAAEPEVYAPAPVVVAAPVGEWTGFYAGAHLGYGKAEGDNAAFDADGALGGVQLGYRWDLGRTVLGVEGAIAASDVKDDATGIKLKNKTDLKLQLGYDLGNSLIYATAGASWAKLDNGVSSISDNGWVAGLGYDYAINDSWVVGGEYLYHKYDDFDATGVDVDGGSFAIRANYRF